MRIIGTDTGLGWDGLEEIQADKLSSVQLIICKCASICILRLC